MTTSPTSLFRNTLLSLIPTALLITLCYFWADPAFSFWVDHENLKRFPIFDYCTHLVDAIMIWSFFYYCYFAWAFSKQTQQAIEKKDSTFRLLSKLADADEVPGAPSAQNRSVQEVLDGSSTGATKQFAATVEFRKKSWPGLNIANSVAISIFIKDALKAPFGRYWPSTWVNNNPSLIHDHAYGFHWFHKGVIYQSFPSGHTTVGVAFMMSLWLAYPRSPWRWLGVLVASAIVMGLLADNYHFIGDCLAGAWVGAITACYVSAATKKSF